ncbi:hypothetical protein RYX36_025596 [Vicia faba]
MLKKNCGCRERKKMKFLENLQREEERSFCDSSGKLKNKDSGTITERVGLRSSWYSVMGSYGVLLEVGWRVALVLNHGLKSLGKGMTLKAESWSYGKNFKAMMKLRIKNNMLRHCIYFGRKLICLILILLSGMNISFDIVPAESVPYVGEALSILRKKGLNPFLFVFVLIANVSYVGSILVGSTKLESLKANMPWMLDATVCVALDIFVSFRLF